MKNDDIRRVGPEPVLVFPIRHICLLRAAPSSVPPPSAMHSRHSRHRTHQSQEGGDKNAQRVPWVPKVRRAWLRHRRDNIACGCWGRCGVLSSLLERPEKVNEGARRQWRTRHSSSSSGPRDPWGCVCGTRPPFLSSTSQIWSMCADKSVTDTAAPRPQPVVGGWRHVRCWAFAQLFIFRTPSRVVTRFDGTAVVLLLGEQQQGRVVGSDRGHPSTTVCHQLRYDPPFLYSQLSTVLPRTSHHELHIWQPTNFSRSSHPVFSSHVSGRWYTFPVLYAFRRSVLHFLRCVLSVQPRSRRGHTGGGQHCWGVILLLDSSLTRRYSL